MSTSKNVGADVGIILTAIAIYKNQVNRRGGVIPAIQWLVDAGYTFDQATEIIAQYDRLEDAVLKGVLP